MGSWERFLEDRRHHNLYVSALVYMPTLKLIRRVARVGDRLLEAGCGSGRSAMLLADMGYRVTALDLSMPLLVRARPALPFFDTLRLVRADLAALPCPEKAFRLSYSCGVLEHFDPPEIVRLLEEQRRVAHLVLVDVPNDRCEAQAFGDERLMGDDAWGALFDQAGLRVHTLVHRGLDNGRYVGNCTVLLGSDKGGSEEIAEEVDVYDHY